MSKNQHRPDDSQLTQNQNNQMSEDPGDGSRNSTTLGGGEKFNKSPEEEAQHDQSTIEAFGQEGAGIAAKE